MASERIIRQDQSASIYCPMANLLTQTIESKGAPAFDDCDERDQGQFAHNYTRCDCQISLRYALRGR